MSTTYVSVNETTPLPQDAPPSIQTSIPDIVCPRCGAGIKKRNGTKKTIAGIFQRYSCQNGHNFTSELHPIKK